MPNYSGMWTLQAQMQAISQGTWTNIVVNSLWSWGQNNNGQLGINDTANRSSPVQVDSTSIWTKTSGGNTFTLLTRQNGTLWATGQNSSGQLGQNNVVLRSSPVQIGALSNWYDISAGSEFSVATKSDGTLWSWGKNQNGQLGQNNLTYLSSPVQVGALTNWSLVSCGGYNVLAIKTDGTLWAWGLNSAGQLGTGNVIDRSSPVQVGALTNWAKVSAGFRNSLAIKTDGTLWSWGRNNQGQLGQNISYSISRSSPVQIGALTTWLTISGGLEHVLATRTDGTLWSWGRNNVGQLGQNISYSISRSSPVQIGSLTNWSSIACGGSISGAIRTDGTLWTWGSNSSGALGINTATTDLRSSPVQVGSETTWLNVGSGNSGTSSMFATQQYILNP